MNEPLLTLSPIDGRYLKHTEILRMYCSEFGLIRCRLIAESNWLQCVLKTPSFKHLTEYLETTTLHLNTLIEHFSIEDAKAIKQIERTTNHDVKAIEYFLRAYLKDRGVHRSVLALIHYACTSEDVNNIAYALILKETKEKILKPLYETLLTHLSESVREYASIPMLSRTHGQCATPTTVGKEFANVTYRLTRQIKNFLALPILAKSNGAVGNFNAHIFCSPETDWISVSHHYVESLGLDYNPYTTQIEPHDNIVEHFDTLSRINTILTDWCRDIWGYISLGYFSQKHRPEEVGSSTMPHKINPIDFENAEGNFGLSTALFRHFSEKLPISRWQRDLSDSTVMRNIGVAIGHHIVGLQSLEKGLAKIEPHIKVLQADITAHPEILTEALQTMMRRHGVSDSYEQLKALSRGQTLTLDSLHAFIDNMDIPSESREKLKQLRPEGYTGLAQQLALDLQCSSPLKR